MNASLHDGKADLSITDREIEQAREFQARVTQARGDESVVIGLRAGGAVAEMPTQLSALVSELVGLLANGAAVTISSVPDEVTTTVAAKMLGISRPTLMKLIADDALPSHKVGSHTRLRSKDVLAYREHGRNAQREAFEDLRKLEDTLDIPFD